LAYIGNGNTIFAGKDAAGEPALFKFNGSISLVSGSQGIELTDNAGTGTKYELPKCLCIASPD